MLGKSFYNLPGICPIHNFPLFEFYPILIRCMILGSQFINNLTVNHNALLNSKVTFGFQAAVLF